MPTKAKNVVSDVDLLEEAIEERPKANPFARLKSPWTGVYILLILTWIKVGGIQDRVFKATDAYSNGPVLVQVGVDAKPILAQQALEGSLNLCLYLIALMPHYPQSRVAALIRG
jgi:hypothetical protein